jgi:hypothetical protein
MSIKSQFMLALGVLSAVLLASANPGLAKTAHHRTHATMPIGLTPTPTRASGDPTRAQSLAQLSQLGEKSK